MIFKAIFGSPFFFAGLTVFIQFTTADENITHCIYFSYTGGKQW